MSKGAIKDYNVNSEMYVKCMVKSIISSPFPCVTDHWDVRNSNSTLGKRYWEGGVSESGTSLHNPSYLKKTLQQFIV